LGAFWQSKRQTTLDLGGTMMDAISLLPVPERCM
jgi:hypothetical protein